MKKNNKTHPRQSWTFDEYTNSEIRELQQQAFTILGAEGQKENFRTLMIYYF